MDFYPNSQIAIMEQAGTISLEAPLLTSYHTPGIMETKVFGYERSNPEMSLEKTINNYLKTPAEMDAEFSMEMNTPKLMGWQQSETYDEYGRIFYKDENINAYSPDDTPSGFMEENY